MAAANNKTQLTDDSVEAFLNTVTDEQQRADSIKVCEMMQISTGEMDWMEIGFSPRKGKFALYGLTGSANADELLPKLGKHKTRKGCLYIQKLSDIDETVLEKLVTDSFKNIKKTALPPILTN